MNVLSSQDEILVIFKEHFINQTLINFINKLNGFCYLGKFQNENQRTEQLVLTPGQLYIRTEFLGESCCMEQLFSTLHF